MLGVLLEAQKVLNESWIAAGPLVQGYIWLKGQRANKLPSQITFCNCKSDAQILPKDVISYSRWIWCFIPLLIKIHCDSAQTGDRQLIAGFTTRRELRIWCSDKGSHLLSDYMHKSLFKHI